ncbi:hypothetical protein BGX30_007265, partial [Mortierella sp. GBA39]
ASMVSVSWIFLSSKASPCPNGVTISSLKSTRSTRPLDLDIPTVVLPPISPSSLIVLQTRCFLPLLAHGRMESGLSLISVTPALLRSSSTAA